MSKKYNNKGVNTYEKTGRKIVITPTQALSITTTLNNAIQEARVPTTNELLDECKAILATVLISLRGGTDVYKSATAIANVVKAISQVFQLERIEEISEAAIANMSDEELKDYASKLIDKMAA